ncbi:MAG: hypothetical protein D3909_17590 [Candidatus Electrothrix sp. ATG1]|nr:hypothetical protein [Candidatus Electrothrix sp. ATG1]
MIRKSRSKFFRAALADTGTVQNHFRIRKQTDALPPAPDAGTDGHVENCSPIAEPVSRTISSSILDGILFGIIGYSLFALYKKIPFLARFIKIAPPLLTRSTRIAPKKAR